MGLTVPEDLPLLQELGKMGLLHGHLDYILRMMIKTLADLTVDEARDATENESSSGLRKRVLALARQRLKEGKPLLKLEALIQRCWRASERRHVFLHAVWAQSWDKDHAEMLIRGNEWKALPTTEEVRALNGEIAELVVDINHARLQGFVHDALMKKQSHVRDAPKE